jgi:hypothetical protein|uniref:Uncharacterized protein n=1 Tax=viral metagenome TaxID=1070528 RepID=A0A6C0BSM4_9ZZZZ
MNIESSTNLSNDNPQRKIIYVGGDDEDYLGTNINGRDNESFNNEQNHNENTNSNRDLNHNSIEKTSEPIHERHLNHNNNKYDSTHKEQYGVINHQEDEFMYGGGKSRSGSRNGSRNGSRSGDDIESSDDETDTSSISTAQLLNVDPVYFRLTKFLTCTDSCGENKNVTHVLNDILTEFKKMNIFLETLTRK